MKFINPMFHNTLISSTYTQIKHKVSHSNTIRTVSHEQTHSNVSVTPIRSYYQSFDTQKTVCRQAIEAQLIAGGGKAICRTATVSNGNACGGRHVTSLPRETTRSGAEWRGSSVSNELSSVKTIEYGKNEPSAFLYDTGPPEFHINLLVINFFF